MNFFPSQHLRYVRRDDRCPCLTLQQWWLRLPLNDDLPMDMLEWPGEWRDVQIIEPEQEKQQCSIPAPSSSS